MRGEIAQKNGEAEAFPTDLAEADAPRRLVSAVVDAFGALEILVNNAGAALSRSVEKTTAEEWDFLMGLNARAPFLLCREALPHLRKSRRGRIVNISSVVGYKGYTNQGAYTASKHALAGFTKVLAQEVMPDGIRVHLVSPGGVDTDLAGAMRPDLDRAGLTTPTEVAETVLFLLGQAGQCRHRRGEYPAGQGALDLSAAGIAARAAPHFARCWTGTPTRGGRRGRGLGRLQGRREVGWG